MKYIVARIKDSIQVLERRTESIDGGEVEVYVTLAVAADIEGADKVASGLNAAAGAPKMVEIPDEPNHYVTFDERGWFITHSVECRRAGEMGRCEYHHAIDDVYDEPVSDDQMGRWKITAIDTEGLPSLERA